MITTPEWWDIKRGDRIPQLFGYGVFEGTCIPPKWAEYTNRSYVTKVIVPSTHTKNAFIKGGTKEDKIVVIPHGVNLESFYPKDRPKNDYYRFLFVGGWAQGENDRKGLEILLRAFCAEFKPEEKVELFLKINSSYQDPQVVINNLESLGLPKDRPRIQVTFDMVDDNRLAEVYRTSDCFVMPTKGEAFCMPCLEAMACGLPVIATDFGGQTDYLPKEGLIKIEKFIPATGEPWIYEWAMWALPSQEHLQQLMRKAFNGELKGHPELAKDYSWKNTANKIVEMMK
jgi:glycosyltransferase involved in cell wall biosynthesis